MHFAKRARITGGVAAVWLLCGLGSTLIYSLAWWYLPLHTLGTKQLYTLGSLVKDWPERSLPIGLVSGSTTLIILYIGGYFALRRLLAQHPGHRRLIAGALVLVPLVFAALLVRTYPFTTLDLYGYLFRGLMVGHYGANTFQQVPSDYQYNPLFWYTVWRDAPTGYGPLWELLAGVVARAIDIAGPQPLAVVAGQTDIERFAPQLLALMTGFKLLGLASVLLCATAIWWALRAPANPSDAQASTHDPALLGVYVWLWNPLVLWELVGGGHNDGWMILGMLVGYGALRRQWARGALVALTVGTLFKYPAAMFGPAVLATAGHIWWTQARARNLAPWRYSLVRLVQSTLVCSALATLSFAPFWFGPGTFSNTMTRERWFNSSLSAVIDVWLRVHTQLPGDEPWRWASRAAMVMIVGTALWAGWHVWRRPNAIRFASLLVALALLLASNVFQPWYITWTLALIALQPQRGRVVASAALLALGGWWTYLAIDFLHPHLTWQTDTIAWQTLMLACIYGLPLLLLLAFALRWLWRTSLHTGFARRLSTE